ncbi:type VI secretion system-associated protein [Rhodovibrio sodomensis]|uniref:Type VI secretion system-associated protein n=1 Tax=Rhodovibrio sodomensis TaxID=1088 RepID=A0ABS1D9N8_9PROT|nr:type VI secretion system baseplate subunit TssK [Rhodovibrio sodomensis]MBK1667141.1 type VI secretion system-associated protein [Rhodovibrio sodomensis]
MADDSNRDVQAPPEPVQWYEGMLLSPQHFQQHARQQEALVAYRLDAVSRYAWGIREVSVDGEALKSGRVIVRQLEAVMPDGLTVQHPLPETRHHPLEITVAPGPDRPVTVYLSVPRYRSADAAPDSVAGRYRSVMGAAERDDNTGADEVPIPRLRPNLQLTHEDALEGTFVHLPLIRLSAEASEVAADPSFDPPRLSIAQSAALTRLVQELCEQMLGKAKALAAMGRSDQARNNAAIQRDTRDQVRAISSCLPTVRALIDAGAHPFEVYLELTRAQGAMTALTGQPPEELPLGYRHTDPMASFRALADALHRQLAAVSARYVVRRFHADPVSGSFYLRIPGSWLQAARAGTVPKLLVGARPNATATPEAVVTWMRNTRIATYERLDDLKRRRVLGAQRQLVQQPESYDLLPLAGTLVFEVTADPALVPADSVLVIAGVTAGELISEIELYVPAQVADDTAGVPAANGGGDAQPAPEP